MYGALTQDLARTYMADREREIARLAIERALGDSSAPRLPARLFAAVRRLRGWKANGVVRPSATVVIQ